MKKHSYKQIKEYIKGFGYQLVSKEYRNNKTKLDLVCPKNHNFEMRYGNFLGGQRCPICWNLRRGYEKKLSYFQVKEYVEVFGYQLVSKEYRNNKTKLDLVCPEGHFFKMHYNNFLFKHRCPVCTGKQRYSYKQIKEYIEGFGYFLVSREYINNHTKLKIVCPKNHSFEMRYNNFQSGQRCPECAKYIIVSKGEKEILNFVQSIYDGKIIENDRKQLINPNTKRPLELDIWLPELNRAIEYNGEWWHKDRKEIDELKQILCQEKGIGLLIIEEKEWMKYKNFIPIENFITQNP
jgi:hypothetical protein